MVLLMDDRVHPNDCCASVRIMRALVTCAAAALTLWLAYAASRITRIRFRLWPLQSESMSSQIEVSATLRLTSSTQLVTTHALGQRLAEADAPAQVTTRVVPTMTSAINTGLSICLPA